MAEDKKETPKRAIIFQAFNLAMKILNEHPEQRNNLTPQNWERVRAGLAQREYMILEPLSYECGVPTSVIIGKEETKGLDHKGDFGELTNRVGIPFFSGEAYFQRID